MLATDNLAARIDKEHMVTDPVAGISFPKHLAGATLELNRETYYCLDEETRHAFEHQRQAAASG